MKKMLTQKEEIHMNSIKQDVPSEYFNEAAVAIFIITPDHEVIFWNKACEILTGISSSKILNTKNHWQPFYKEHRPCLVDIVIDGTYSLLPELYIKYGKSEFSPEGINAEGWYESIGGEKRYMIFDAVPVFNSSGEIVAAIETLHDSTELKQIELKKENMISELNNHISKNTSLKGFVCMCASCKDIRNKDGVWTALEEYFRNKTDLVFSHGICPKCSRKLYPDFFDKIRFE
jgi:transcriptional regulator with PAS, ATPase and Fis domain